MPFKLSLLFALFLIAFCRVGLAQDAATSAMDRANPQRTGVYASALDLHPDAPQWQSDKLFIMQRSISSPGIYQDNSRGIPAYEIIRGPVTEGTDFYYLPPVVQAGTIYFSLYIGDGYLFGVDAATGKLKWKLSKVHEEFTHPTVVGDYLYVGLNHIFHALDLKTQRELWKYDTGDKLSFDTAPLVVDGVVYFGSFNGTFYALDAKTGKEDWSLKTGSRTYWDNPVLSDGTVYCAEANGPIHALDAKTGQERWKLAEPKGVSSIAFAGDVLYFVDFEGYINAVDTRSGKPKPEFQKRNRTITELALYDGKVYFGGWDSGSVFAVDGTSGEKVWKFEINDRCRTPAIAQGVIYVACFDQKIYAIDAKTGKKNWLINANQKVMSPPVVADGAIYYIADDGKVHAIK